MTVIFPSFPIALSAAATPPALIASVSNSSFKVPHSFDISSTEAAFNLPVESTKLSIFLDNSSKSELL